MTHYEILRNDDARTETTGYTGPPTHRYCGCDHAEGGR